MPWQRCVAPPPKWAGKWWRRSSTKIQSSRPSPLSARCICWRRGAGEFLLELSISRRMKLLKSKYTSRNTESAWNQRARVMWKGPKASGDTVQLLSESNQWRDKVREFSRLQRNVRQWATRWIAWRARVKPNVHRVSWKNWRHLFQFSTEVYCKRIISASWARSSISISSQIPRRNKTTSTIVSAKQRMGWFPIWSVALTLIRCQWLSRPFTMSASGTKISIFVICHHHWQGMGIDFCFVLFCVLVIL